MPTFTKTVSQLTRPDLLSAANVFSLDATGSVAALRARLKAHIDANEHFMGNSNYYPLFSREQRCSLGSSVPTGMHAPLHQHRLLGADLTPRHPLRPRMTARILPTLAPPFSNQKWSGRSTYSCWRASRQTFSLEQLILSSSRVSTYRLSPALAYFRRISFPFHLGA